MKNSIQKIILIVTTVSILITSCQSVKNTNKTQRGAAIGAVGGAVLGGILGNNIGKGGNGALGAVLGGVIGGVAGGLIGRKMDKQAREIATRLPGAQVERVGEGIKLVLGENSVRFNVNKATLTPTAQTNLDKLVPVFKEYADTDITIYGHTDSDGTDELNYKLSELRSASVKKYLASKGIDATRVITKGLGELEPVEANETAHGKAQNRRVEFAITANDKMVQDAQKEAGK